MVLSLTAVIVVAMIIFLLTGLISFGLLTWKSASNTMSIGGYIFEVHNGVETFIESTPTIWPYTRTSTQITATYLYLIPALTPADPSLPILLTLPTNATNLLGVVAMSSHSLPLGQTSMNVVQYGTNTLAMQYEPSMQYATGAELTTPWTLSLSYIYTIAP